MVRSRPNLRRWATGLFDQQLWCWDRDVARAAGNVLLELGMCRYRVPDPKCSSLYKATLEGDAEVWLYRAVGPVAGIFADFVRRRLPTPFIRSEAMAKGNKDARSYVKLQSSESAHCYYVQKNRRNTTERLELRKYDPVVRKHVIYREGKR